MPQATCCIGWICINRIHDEFVPQPSARLFCLRSVRGPAAEGGQAEWDRQSRMRAPEHGPTSHDRYLLDQTPRAASLAFCLTVCLLGSRLSVCSSVQVFNRIVPLQGQT